MSRCLTSKFGGLTRSECRRTVMVVGVPLAVIGLFFWYVWAAQAKAFWLLPILGSFIIGFGLIAVQVKYQYNLLIPSFFIHMLVNLDLLPTLPGRLLWYILRLGARCKYCREIHRGSLISLGALGLYAGLGLGWGNSVLGFVNVALCAVP